MRRSILATLAALLWLSLACGPFIEAHAAKAATISVAGGGMLIGNGLQVPGAAAVTDVSALDQPALPALQALHVPGGVYLPPDGVAWPYQTVLRADTTTPPLVAVVTNRSNQVAAVGEDGAGLSIAVPAGYIPLPDLPCVPQAEPAVTFCPLSDFSFVDFDAADATQPQALPIVTTVHTGQSLALSAVASDGSGAIAAVGIALIPSADGTSAQEVGISWDGASLVLSAPAGYRILDDPLAPLASQGCTPTDGSLTAVICAAPGSAPRLFDVATVSLDHQRQHPPGTPPSIEPSIVIAPAIGGVYRVGQPVTFSATIAPGVVAIYFWGFGDDSGIDGMVVQHTYTTPGQYEIFLSTVFSEGGILGVTSTTATITVLPAASPG